MTRKKTATATLALQPVLDLNAATPLLDELRLARGKDIKIDASGVERIGTPCVQVLMSARKSWQADGRAFTVEAASEPFSRTLQTIGIDDDNLTAKEFAQ